MKIRKKEFKETSVYEEALARTRYIYENADHVSVSFSGGKDSTAVLNIALQVAREKNKLPLHVVFFDEEAIHPPTIEYVKRVSENPDINLDWYCLEFKHRNACSNEEPFWFTWDKDKKDKWVRPMPENAITEHKYFRKGMSFQEFCQYIYPRDLGNVYCLVGIRTEESLTRYRVIARKKNDHFMNTHFEGSSSTKRAFPIYDWSSKDVWLAVKKFGWDYNTTYDIMNKTKMFGKYLIQRVCPPFGEEPLRGLWMYAECFPEMWHKMLNRVKGVNTAWRYANTELYSNASKKPEDLTYKEYFNIVLKSYDFDYQNIVKKTANSYIKYHKNNTSQIVPDEEYHPLSGVSWKFLCDVVIRGDFKGRQKPKLIKNSQQTINKLKITLEEAKLLYS